MVMYMKENKKLVVSILAVLSVLLVTLGLSLAFFNYIGEGVQENAITTGSITFLYTEVDGVGNGISIENAFPTSDEKGKVLTKANEYFDFKVTSNTMSYVSVPYEITARKSKNSNLSDEAVRVYLTELEGLEEKEILLDNYSNLPQTNKTDKYTEKTIYTDEVPINTESYEKNFRLRMWIDEKSDYSSGEYNGKTFTLTVNVYSNSNSNIDTSITTNPKDTSVAMVTANNMYLFDKVENEEVDYTLTVPKEVDSLDITVTPNNMHATSTVEKIDNLANSNNIKRLSYTTKDLSIEPGENYFKAIVTSSDKSKNKEYILKVTREKDKDNSLLILEVDGYSLNPVFDKDILEYDLSLEASSIEIKAETTSKVAQVEGLGVKELSWGENTFEIKVTAQDDSVRTYKITINNIRPTAPVITGGSNSWVTTSPIITLVSQGTAISNVKHYEYYKSTLNVAPTDTTTATGTTTGDITITDEGTTYIWYRTVSNNGYKSLWTSSPQVVKLDKENPKVTVSVKEKIATFTVSDSLGVIAYGVNQSTETEPSYTSITNTTNSNIDWKASAGGNYVIWVKDNAGKTATASFTVSTSIFIAVGKTWTWSSPGAYTFSVPVTGNYKVELWGAAGGSSYYSYSGSVDAGFYPSGSLIAGGRGGYTSGNINLGIAKTLYVHVGAKGTDGIGDKSINATCSYNGGGYGGDQYQGGGAGGGATDIRVINGAWNNFDSLKSRIMVAGAGSGTSNYNNGTAGGAGGGLTGYGGALNPSSASHTIATGGTQTSGGGAGGTTDAWGNPGKFGSGGNSQVGHGSGGGSGYYGGGGSGFIRKGVSSGAGGSSFISGHNGCNAINSSSTSSSISHTGQSVHYSGYKFTNTVMIDGNGYKWTTAKGSYTGMPNFAGTATIAGNTGNGYAKITYLGD